MSQDRPDDWRTVRDTIDLAAVVTNLLGPAPGRRGESGGRLWWNCPFHEDRNPSFSIRKGDKTWRCFGCGARGDAAALVMELNGWSFPEAVAYLTGGSLPSGKAAPRPAKRQAPDPPADPSGFPHDDAVAFVEAAAARLWTPEGADALDYLTSPRRLTPETIRAARLGVTDWVTIPGKEGTTFKALGVVIPWFASGRLTLVKIRQPDDRRPKYVEAFRDPARLVCYPGPETIRPGRALVIVEGEFDALCLGEALGELAAVVTLGSASARPAPGILGRMLAAAPWFIATDRDEAGDKAASGWPPRAARVRPPGSFKDWTEARQEGVNLRRWWIDRLAGNKAPSLFSWDELAALRWGPAAADPAPGLMIDRPDPERSQAALRAADLTDAYALAERSAIQAGNE